MAKPNVGPGQVSACIDLLGGVWIGAYRYNASGSEQAAMADKWSNGVLVKTPPYKYKTTLNVESLKPHEDAARAELKDNGESSDLARLYVYFSSPLYEALGSLPKGTTPRDWYLDDFSFQSIVETTKKYSLKGEAYWLTGGKGCSEVQIDIENSSELFRYSFKFWHKNSPQNLYIARMEDHWIVTHTDSIR